MTAAKASLRNRTGLITRTTLSHSYGTEYHNIMALGVQIETFSRFFGLRPCAATKFYCRTPASSRMRSIRRSGSAAPQRNRSEEHTSELQSPTNLVCRLLLEKKK